VRAEIVSRARVRSPVAARENVLVGLERELGERGEASERETRLCQSRAVIMDGGCHEPGPSYML
jgi:hypothetical protein